MWCGFGTWRLGDDRGQFSWVAAHQVSGSHVGEILSPSRHMAVSETFLVAAAGGGVTIDF